MKIHYVVVDPGRDEHIARHHVTAKEVEVIRGNVSVTRSREGRYRVIGQMAAGRYLTVIIAPRGQGVYGLVTARDADDTERRIYLRHREREHDQG
ncbi:MAG: BrnT family toxin [Chloroflexi bacterium]|nr:BrnT family toxin [Chloroflexota bacterium]